MKSILILLCVVALVGFIVSQVDKPLTDSMRAYKAEMVAIEGEPKSSSALKEKQDGELTLPEQANQTSKNTENFSVEQMNKSDASSDENNGLTLLSGDNGINFSGVGDLIASENFE
jgi:hypothetical protein